MTSSIYEWSVKYLASKTVVLVLEPLILLWPKSARYFMYNITNLLPGNKISGKFYIILRNYSQCAPSQLSVYFFFIYLFIFFTSVLNNFPEKWTWLTLSKLTRIDYSTLRFSFSIAQHIQNNESTCAVLRLLEALFSPHNLTSGHDYCRFWAKRNCEIITMLLRKSSVWSICCSLSFLNTNEQLIFMRFSVIRSLYDQS